MSNIDQHNNPDSNDMDDTDAVGRAYRDARESDGMLPPPALDDAIRAAARRAVHAGPQLVGKTWMRKWTPQLAVAAVVVLSVSVVFVSVEERPDLAPAPIQKIALKREAEAPAAALAPLETKILREAVPVPVPVPAPVPVPVPPGKLDANDARQVMAKKALPDSAVIAADSFVPRENSAVVAKQELIPPRMSAQAPASLSAAATPVAPPVYAPPAPPAVASPPAAASRYVPPPEVSVSAPAPFPGTIADASAPLRKEARADAGASGGVVAEAKVIERIRDSGSARSRDAADRVANAPTRPASAAAAPAPATIATAPATMPHAPKQLAPNPAPAASLPSPVIASPISPISPNSPISSPTPARALESDIARSNAQSSESAGARVAAKDKLAEDQRTGPWLKRLLAMREQGKLKELREEIVRFRKIHPNVVLPKSLTELPPE